MKVFVFLAFVAVAHCAAVVYKHPTAHVPATSAFQTQDVAGNYAFGYHDGKPEVATFHRESGSAGAKVGSYGMTSADGKVRIVDYVADAGGYRAKIKTNEEGVDTDAKDPAGVSYDDAKVENLVPVVPAIPYYAPYPGYVVAGPNYAYAIH